MLHLSMTQNSQLKSSSSCRIVVNYFIIPVHTAALDESLN